MKKYSFILLLLAFFLQACGGTGDGTNKPRRSPNVITSEELASSPTVTPGQSLYDAIKFMRPQFLIPRGAGASTEPVVYVDNIRRGGIASLYELFVSQVSEIRYMSASEATTRFGTGHPGGAILVKTGSKQ